jgi:hypothetical protein
MVVINGHHLMMKKIALASVLMIFLSLITTNAEACSGRCAAAHHQVKHAKRSNMGGAFLGAYHR